MVWPTQLCKEMCPAQGELDIDWGRRSLATIEGYNTLLCWCNVVVVLRDLAGMSRFYPRVQQ